MTRQFDTYFLESDSITGLVCVCVCVCVCACVRVSVTAETADHGALCVKEFGEGA